MKKYLLILIFIFTTPCLSAQDKVGIRVGDFLSLDYKHHFTEKISLELMVGQSLFWGYNYKYKFNEYIKETNYDVVVNRFESDVEVKDRSSIGAGARLLFGTEFENIPHFYWYYGVGAQYVRMKHSFLFRHKKSFASRPNEFIITATTATTYVALIGLDAIVGLEYSFQEVPLNLFADFSIFTELLAQPGSIMAQAGLGIRYEF